MTTGRTPWVGIEFPYGDDPISNGDDVFQRAMEKIDEVLHGMSQQQAISTKVVWAGSQVMTKDSNFDPAFTIVEDQTAGSGVLAPLDDNEGNGPITGIRVPRAGLWYVEAYSRYVPSALANGTSCTLDSTILIDGVYRRAVSNHVSVPSSASLQIICPFPMWFAAGTSVRSRSRVNQAGITVVEQACRLVGPLTPTLPIIGQ